jgi:cytoskeletal protein CcmA (bactofilin family)
MRVSFNNLPFLKTKFLVPGEMVLLGPLQASTGGRVDGLVKGDVTVTGTLVVGKKAEIRGNVNAAAIVVYGSVYGDIFCADKAVVYNTAYIKGNITATTIDIKEGALIEGVITKKADEAVIQAHTAETVVEEDIPPPEPKAPVHSSDEDKNATTWF